MGRAVLTLDLGIGHIGLQGFRDGHHRRLYLVPLVVQLVHRQWPVGIELVHPAMVELGLQEPAPVFQARIGGGHLVGGLVDGGAVVERIRLENQSAVGQPNLGIFERVCTGLRLGIFSAVGEVNAETGGQLFVELVVPQAFARAIFPGGGHPPQGTRCGVESVIQLTAADPQLAQVVTKHGAVHQPFGNFAFRPDTGGV